MKATIKASTNSEYQRKELCADISLSLSPLATPLRAQDDRVDEVVVTGFYIRRDQNFTQASLVIQLSAEDLVDEVTLHLGELVQNLSFVKGPGPAITNTI